MAYVSKGEVGATVSDENSARVIIDNDTSNKCSTACPSRSNNNNNNKSSFSFFLAHDLYKLIEK